MYEIACKTPAQM